MGILIIAFHPRFMTPYITPYETAIKKRGIPYDVLFWDRFHDRPLEKKGNEYIFHCTCTLGGKRYKKFYPFYLFRQAAISVLAQGRYDKIIVLNTMPGFLLHDILLRTYSGRYIFDIRDYTYERYSFYRKIVQKLIANSCFTALSSRAFATFLGFSDKYVYVHNVSNIGRRTERPSLTAAKAKVTVGFVGVVRYPRENEMLIKKLSGSKRYILKYVGITYPDCRLRDFCAKHYGDCTIFRDKFDNEDKPVIYETIDFINNIYGDSRLEVTTAVSNRFYDGLIFKKPILASKHTYVGDLVETYHLGISVDVVHDDVYSLVEAYIRDFDGPVFAESADRVLQQVVTEQNYFCRRLEQFI